MATLPSPSIFVVSPEPAPLRGISDAPEEVHFLPMLIRSPPLRLTWAGQIDFLPGLEWLRTSLKTGGGKAKRTLYFLLD